MIEERRSGTRRLYRARQERLADVRGFLESFWGDGLAAVKRSGATGAPWMTGTSGVIVREVFIDASPEEVFPYFTDAAKMVLWKAFRAEIDGRPGGEFRIDVTGAGDVAPGAFLEIDAPRRVVFTWAWEPRDPTLVELSTSIFEVTLTPDGDGTRLVLVHSGVPGERMDRSAAGWGHYLARLALAAVGLDPGPDPLAGKPGGRSAQPQPNTEKGSDGHRTQQGHFAASLRRGHESA